MRRWTPDHEMLAELEQTIAVLQLHAEALAGLMRYLDSIELTPATRKILETLGVSLGKVGISASAACSRIARLPKEDDKELLPWDEHLQNPGTMIGKCGRTIKTVNAIPPGVRFRIDDYWRGGNGALIGVTWKMATRPFDWVPPHAIRASTRLIAEDNGHA